MKKTGIIKYAAVVLVFALCMTVLPMETTKAAISPKFWWNDLIKVETENVTEWMYFNEKAYLPVYSRLNLDSPYMADCPVAMYNSNTKLWIDWNHSALALSQVNSVTAFGGYFETDASNTLHYTEDKIAIYNNLATAEGTVEEFFSKKQKVYGYLENATKKYDVLNIQIEFRDDTGLLYLNCMFAPESKVNTSKYQLNDPELKINDANITFKYSKTKKQKQTRKISASAKSKLTYKVVTGKNNISVDKKGKVTAKKGCKKGTYKVAVTAESTKIYKSTTKYVTIRVK